MEGLKDVINDLRVFTNEHPQMNGFGWGNLANITTKNYIYPMMWVQPMQSTIQSSQLKLSLDVYIMDLLEHDYSNELDIMNGTLMLGRDLVAEYFEDNDGVEFELDESNVKINPFSGKFDDLLGGWIFTVELTIMLSRNKCLTPTI